MQKASFIALATVVCVVCVYFVAQPKVAMNRRRVPDAVKAADSRGDSIVTLSPDDIETSPDNIATPSYGPQISPATGTNLIPEAANAGKGELIAVNGSDLNAVLVVVRTSAHRATVREVAIRAQETAKLRHLSKGNYSIYFCNSGCFEFGEDVSYAETSTEDGTQYARYTITLTPVPDGNVVSKPISKEEFEMATGVRL